MAAIGALVIKQRLELGLSQKGLARSAGVDVKTLRSLESGERWPQDVNRHRIENALGWRQGAMAEIRDNEDADPALSNLKVDSVHGDEEWPDEERPVTRAADLTDSELLSELTYRFKKYARREEGISFDPHLLSAVGTQQNLGEGVVWHRGDDDEQETAQRDVDLAAMSGPNRGRQIREQTDAAGEESQETVDHDQHR